jgi:hypothetical protein
MLRDHQHHRVRSSDRKAACAWHATSSEARGTNEQQTDDQGVPMIVATNSLLQPKLKGLIRMSARQQAVMPTRNRSDLNPATASLTNAANECRLRR